MTIVTGARLTPGGLHLGHYVGCFSSMTDDDDGAIFVIGDRAAEGQQAALTTSTLVAMLADIGALDGRVRVVLQSHLHASYEELLHRVEAMVTFRQLQATHPAKRRIRAGDFDASVKAFLFPLDSACTYLVLDADVVMMNDDNQRIVALAQRLAKRINGLPSRGVVRVPRLVHGKEPRIVGYNYKKMSKGNGNAIFFADDDQTLAKKIEDLLSLKYFLRGDPMSRVAYASAPAAFVLPQTYAPFVLLRALGYTLDESTRKRLQLVSGRAELRSLLTAAIRSIIVPVRARSTELRNAPTALLAQLEAETEQVCARARRRVAEICAAIDGALRAAS